MDTRASWKIERRKKYRTSTGADQAKRPLPGAMSKCYVNGYIKRDGTRVRGHERRIDPL
jgi:hypothetical protein